MRYFALYLAFFSFLFSYIFKANAHEAMISASNLLFSYFVFTTALSISIAFVLLLAFKRGFNFSLLSPIFSGLLKGAAGVFFLNLLANRAVLLTGSYVLTMSIKDKDIYTAFVAALFLFMGYTLFRPFNFDFKSSFAGGSHFEAHAKSKDDTTTIDVEVVEYFDKLEKK